MDFADISSEMTELVTAAAIDRERRNLSTRMTPNGSCQNPKCEDDLEYPKVFCSPECRDEYDFLRRRKNGGHS